MSNMILKFIMDIGTVKDMVKDRPMDSLFFLG